MTWTLGGTRIYVTEFGGDDNQIIASLNVLGGGTIRQIFGYEDESLRLVCLVVGDTDRDAIVNMSKSGTTHSLVNGSTIGSFYVSKVSWTRTNAIYQTLTSDCDAPVYSLNVELLAT